MMYHGLAKPNVEEIKTSKYCIVYLDILGAKNIIKNDKDCKFLNDLNKIVYDANCDAGMLSEFSDYHPFIKMFSDNVLFGLQIAEDTNIQERQLGALFNIAKTIQNGVLRYGYLLRGAVTIGDIYENNQFVCGEALVRVVEMEENLAIYPRIIATNDVVEKAPQYFNIATDGEYYVRNYRYDQEYYIFPHKENLLNMVKKYKNNHKIMQKVMWAISDFNISIEQCDPVGMRTEYKITQQDIYEYLHD